MLCSNCKNELKADANFCPKCGGKVANAPTVGTNGTFTDPRDGRVYKTVKIGNQVWMAENLAYNAEVSKAYGEGSEVTGIDYESEVLEEKLYTLSEAEIQAYCDKYGRLYDWETAMKACPDGWHLPSENELQTLIDFAGGEDIAGKKLKATKGWNDNYDTGDDDKIVKTSGNGTDDFGFSALPGGQRYYEKGDEQVDSYSYFTGAGFSGNWWSATEYKNDWGSTDYDTLNILTGEKAYCGCSNKIFLLSVRCIKDL